MTRRPRERRVDWRHIRSRLPMSIALAGVAAVWALGAVWSFTEQHAFARAKGFADPALLPLVIDGFAVATACVAFAASLDGRPAVPARIGTAIAVLASAVSNGWWAGERSIATGRIDLPTIVMGVCVPVFANIAFEVLLAESRRQVQRARGLAAPVAVPTLRIVRLVLDPWGTFTSWRRLVLELTALAGVPAAKPRPRRVERRAVPIDPPTEPIRIPSTALAEDSTPSAAVLEPDPESPGVAADTSGPLSLTQARRRLSVGPVAPVRVPAVPRLSSKPVDTTPPPPVPTGRKKEDAKAWTFWQWSLGENPLLSAINDAVKSDSLIKRQELRAWRDEYDATTNQEPARLRAVEG